MDNIPPLTFPLHPSQQFKTLKTAQLKTSKPMQSIEQAIYADNQPQKIPTASQILDAQNTLSYLQNQLSVRCSDLDYFNNADNDGNDHDNSPQVPRSPLIKLTQQEDFNEKFLSTIEDNGLEILVPKISCTEKSQVLVMGGNIGRSEILAADDHRKEREKKYGKRIEFQDNNVGDDPELQGLWEEMVQQANRDTVDWKALLRQNHQLKNQRNQLLKRVAFLQIENKDLKEKVQTFQQTQLKSLVQNEKQIYPTLEQTNTPQRQNLTNSLQKIQSNSQSHFTNFQSSQPTVNNSMNKSSVDPIRTSLKVGDEWAQQYIYTKRPYKESPLFEFFDTWHQRMDISYKQLSLIYFEKFFFPFDWSQVKTLIVDGNRLKTEGFDRLIYNLGPSLTQISAGYNSITDVRNLEKLQNLCKVDLRANPLSQVTKVYLNKLKVSTKIQILF